ncbi:MAG: Capsule polysaccharide biosynthesis protein [Candidatus Woesearchaeota archaeon]|nr:Capsule polysaccharide biosynthesis protein [Candidatus Woesearchaeota archaeon]
MSVKIFYKFVPRNVPISEQDIGIFVEKKESFPGKQYVLKELKPKNLYKYQKFFFEIVNKYPNLFKVQGISLESLSQIFFLRTFNLPYAESLGDSLLLIEILSEIFKDNSMKKCEILCYIPSSEISKIFIEYFRVNKIKKYKFIFTKKIDLSFLYSFFNFFHFIRFVFLLVLGYYNKIKVRRKGNLSKICFISANPKRNIHKNAESVLIRNSIDFDEIFFDYKNAFFRFDFKYYSNLITFLKKNRSHRFVGEFLHLADFLRILSLFSKEKKKLLSLLENVDSISYNGILINSIFQKLFKIFIQLYLFYIIETKYIIERIFFTYKFIFFSYNAEDRISDMISVVPNEKVKKFSLQYELIYPGSVYYFYKNHQHIELVWNEFSKNVLKEYYNYPDDKVFVIGNIRFDKFEKESHNGINVVFTSQDAFPEVLVMFLKSVKNVKNPIFNFFVKLHPGDDINKIRETLEQLNLSKKVKIIRGPIIEALKIADIIVSYSSTTLLESLYNQIPVIVINPFSEEPQGVPFYKHVLYFKEEQEFIRFLEKIKSSRELRKIKVPKEFMIKDFDEALFKELLSDAFRK